ncbi:DUF3618 domain-containing protein [Mycobacterium sp. 236(2023)]|uniref:DUF3618 domain-containing protein n=1 Tax=Mycobacterium sp. 236(2023) TaxID=3038163 RepID=UPI0024151606|nr:DUF3618 domain-containing protein [Mycobacterium sp. 236(2023)]MDG4667926.1 DUF3618 domain-containing protein [Mycobacterium sp. 236(2023)]
MDQGFETPELHQRPAHRTLDGPTGLHGSILIGRTDDRGFFYLDSGDDPYECCVFRIGHRRVVGYIEQYSLEGEATTRNLLYVALTRGRRTNTAHLYERSDAGLQQSGGQQASVRSDSAEAAQFAFSLITRAGLAQTAHELASRADPARIPARVTDLVKSRADERGISAERETGYSLDL